MKKLISHAILIIAVVVLLPFLIVKGCSYSEDKKEKEEQVPQLEVTRIRVFLSEEERVEEMPLEDYIEGVLAAEMPADFELEALKAQAVAARTYAFGRMAGIYRPSGDVHPDADICTDFSHCQAWVDKEAAYKKWDAAEADKNWEKIQKAVLDTKDIILVYEGKVVNPVFHSNSGGATENSEEVWEGVAEPYLRSVESPGEDLCPTFSSSVLVNLQTFRDTIKGKYPDLAIETKDLMESIKVQELTTGGRVKTLQVGNVSLKGTEVRELFSLRSARFTIEKEDDETLKITCRGYGHGVGMSQWGSNYFAQNGESFDYILKYYYSGVELDTIDGYKLRTSALN